MRITSDWLKHCLIYFEHPSLPRKSLKIIIQIQTWIKISNKYLFTAQAYQVLISVCSGDRLQSPTSQCHSCTHCCILKGKTCFVYAKQICNTTYTINSKLNSQQNTPHQCHSSTMLYQLQACLGYVFFSIF